MASDSDFSYWSRFSGERLSRRSFVRGAALGGAGLAAAALIGCGDDDEDEAAPAAATAAPAAATAAPTEAPDPTASEIIGDNWGVRDEGVVKYGGTINAAAGSPVLANLDPIESGSAMVHQTASNAYSSLMRVGREIDDRNSPIYYPDIALSWEIPGPTEMVFHLRDNAKFHNVAPVNGRALTSEDVKYSILRSATNEKSRFKGALSAISEVETPDATTAVVQLSAFDPLIFNDLAGHYVWIVPREVDEAGKLQELIVGSGPFIFDRWEQDSRIAYKKNPDFHVEGVPFVDELNWLQIANSDTRFSAFESGQSLVSGLNSQEALRVEGDPNILVESFLSVSPFVIFMNFKDQLWQDERVRKALSLAVDPDIVLKLQSGGNGLWRGVISNQHSGWTLSQEELKSDRYYLRQNQAEAMQLLDAAGFGDGLETSFLYNTSWPPYYQETVQYIAQAMAEVGVKVNLLGQEHATMRKNQDENNYEGLAFGADGQPQAESYLLDYRTGGPKNGSGVSLPWLDDAVNAVVNTIDLEERQEKAKSLSSDILEQVLYKIEYNDSRRHEGRRSNAKNWLGPPPHWYVTSGFAYTWLDDA